METYDQSHFSDRWAAYQEDHKIFYRRLHRKGGLFPTESQQLDMDKFLAGPAQYEKIHKTEQAMLDLLKSIAIVKTEQIYGNGYPVYQGQIDNSLGLSIKRLGGKVLLKDQAGTVVDERFFIVEAWVENGRATIDFITPKTFEQTELVLDYFVAQWPWQVVEELGGN
ncbi:hypothetical protein [Streptococcus suis]|uniref:hypothetical protein n=2 Tax=Streptococcus suis TaxID=1307 RepID=UPI001478297C